MSDQSQCPGCGNEVLPAPRYPSYFCRECHRLAVDGQGHSLKFANQTMSGGFTWSNDGGGTWNDDHHQVICLINGEPALARERYLGGTVAQPLSSVEFDPSSEQVADLR